MNLLNPFGKKKSMGKNQHRRQTDDDNNNDHSCISEAVSEAPGQGENNSSKPGSIKELDGNTNTLGIQELGNMKAPARIADVVLAKPVDLKAKNNKNTGGCQRLGLIEFT